MKDTLKPGIEYRHTFRVTENKTVPALYPESEEFIAMPEVFATGFMVGLIEWACIRSINPHLDWPEEQTVGIHINVNHVAATPPGLDVTVKTRLMEVDGRRLVFSIEAHDGIELISQGTHERFVIKKENFDSKMKQKAENKEA
jgi:fluoroacetyl-CoA thioesterase